jgi:glycosyltransferase involved in cell wall biosynthesis
MNLCFVCAEYPPALHGGIGSVVQASARALVAQGHSVRVLGTCPPHETALGYEEDQGVQVWRLSEHPGRGGWIKDRWELYSTLRSWVSQGEIDLVEVPDWLGRACLWPSLGVPVIVRLHGSATYFSKEIGDKPKALMQWLEKRSFHRADFCSSCSQYTAARTVSIFGTHRAQVEVIYNAVALSGFDGRCERNRKRVIYAGTLTKKKGIIQLVRAWNDVNRQNPDAELHIYGKDPGTAVGQPLTPRLRSLLSDQARGSVRFHGHIVSTDLRELYRSCGAAVFPSYAEAFAMAPMEAMAEGCPVINSSRTSGRELVEDGVNGLLVDPDRTDEMAAKILSVLSDNLLADRLGEAGRETIRRQFNASELAGPLSTYYSRCIKIYSQASLPNAGTAATEG